MRSIAALSALAVPALALSYSHGDPRSVKRHHQLAEQVLEQRDLQQVAPSSGRMARKIKRGDAAALSTPKAKKEAQTYTTTAIWYAETGWIGSCGVEFNDNDLVLGLPLELYPNPAEKSELCGHSVVVKNSATGQEITAVVADASQRDAYTTFTKGAYQALGGDLDVGELSVSYHFANADSIASSLPSAFSTSATGKEKSAVKTSASSQAPQTSNAGASSSKPYSKGGNVAAASVAAQTTQAPTTTTSQAPAYDSASAASASSKAAADAAWASSSSAEAAKLWASSSAAQAAASASAKAEADAAWAASSSAAAAASSKAAADAAAASSKAAADAAWASSSSKAAAAAATSAASNNNNSGGGSGHTYSGGIATFFYQNGVAGNCGNVNSDSTLLVALPTATYEGGAHCGKYVTITRSDTGKSINALVADSCPTCNNNACLDLSWGAFSALGGTESMGVFDITWQFDN
ncbi:hypothetical protein JCM11491_003092 [Sporobolomyces phaffii]